MGSGVTVLTEGRIIFWIEASRDIGMGHLMECLALADFFRHNETGCHFIINSYRPAEELLLSKNISFDIIAIDQVENVCQTVRRHAKETCVIVNHRNVNLSNLKTLKKEHSSVAVIDQLGDKEIICDLLINSAIVPEWLEYTFESCPPKCCFGAEFAVLRKEFIELHESEKIFPETNKRVLVTMGGVDRTGATLRVMEALKQLDGNVNTEVILGSGFPHMTEFVRTYEKFDKQTCTYAQGVNNLAVRMQKADIAISAGGNTLYEMACVGTPGIVLWEDPHENMVGQAFAEKGAVLNIGNGIAISVLDIRGSIENLLNHSEKRVEMSLAGKKLVDGQGVRRISEAIVNLMQK